MLESFADVLRTLREVAGLSLADLSARTHYSRSLICNIEAGRRRPTAEYAEACDVVFGTSPLLTLLMEIDGTGDTVRRRAFIRSVGTVTTTIGLGGATALAEVVRSGMLEGSDIGENWTAAVSQFERRLAVAPTQEFGSSLLAQLLVAKQQLSDNGRSPELLQAVANLGQLYALWLGNQAQVPAARGWHRTATVLADQSGDALTRVHVRGRALSRGVYEGASVAETVTGVGEALSLTKTPTVGALESYSALVHVHALTSNVREGRAAVAGMREVAESLPDGATAQVANQRTVLFNNYIECRIGSTRDAQRAFDEAEPLLRALPVWHADASIYFARSQVLAGDVDSGVTLALDAVKNVGADVQVLKVDVQDLLSVVPAQYRSDALDELTTHAATGPAPWETIS